MKNIEAFINRCIIIYNTNNSIKYKFVLNNLSFGLDTDTTSSVGKLRMRPEDFNLIKVIGRGAYGEVQLVS